MIDEVVSDWALTCQPNSRASRCERKSGEAREGMGRSGTR
jgi:hypothetical protein